MQNRIELIFNNKILFSGIAILMVLFYHQPPDGIIRDIYFYPGFVGVDIFLLFSGFGLCYSIKKYSLLQFYKRRIVRILPMLLLMGFFVSFHFKGYSVWDFICNMTSLSYYRLGGNVYEWYLASLLLFYLFFPMLYNLTVRYLKNNIWAGGCLLTLWIIIIALGVTFEIPWYYQTAYGRLPIFLLGILCYFSLSSFKVGLVSFSVITMPVVLLYCIGMLSTYMLVYCLAPWFIFFLTYVIPTIQKNARINKVFSFLGQHSLEIYVANVLVSIYTKSFFHGVEASLFYWGAHIVVVPIFCWLNTIIAKKISVL